MKFDTNYDPLKHVEWIADGHCSAVQGRTFCRRVEGHDGPHVAPAYVFGLNPVTGKADGTLVEVPDGTVWYS